MTSEVGDLPEEVGHALLLIRNAGMGVSALSVILTIQRKFKKQILYKMSQYF